MKLREVAGSGVVLMVTGPWMRSGERGASPPLAGSVALVSGEVSLSLERPLDPRQAALLAQRGQRLVQAEADPLTRRRHPQGVDDVGQLDALLLHEGPDPLLQAGRVERLLRLQHLQAALQQLAGAGRLADALVERLVVDLHRLVGPEEVRVVEDVAGDLDPLARRL